MARSARKNAPTTATKKASTNRSEGRPFSDANPGNRFAPGNPGRPKGSRNKLGENFIQALHDNFQENGPATIETVRVERPHEYLKVIASLLPKQVEIKETAFDDISDDELAALIAAARSALGVSPEGGARAGDEVQSEPAEKLPAVH
jgi:hypothetical protein